MKSGPSITNSTALSTSPFFGTSPALSYNSLSILEHAKIDHLALQMPTDSMTAHKDKQDHLKELSSATQKEFQDKLNAMSADMHSRSNLGTLANTLGRGAANLIDKVTQDQSNINSKYQLKAFSAKSWLYAAYRTYQGITPLAHAVYERDAQTILELSKHEDINEPCANGKTPLDISLEMANEGDVNLEIIESVLRAGAKTNAIHLLDAIQYGQTHIGKLLLEYGVKVGPRALSYAISRVYDNTLLDDIIKKCDNLYQCGDNHDLNAAVWAMRRMNYGAVSTLIEAGINIEVSFSDDFHGMRNTKIHSNLLGAFLVRRRYHLEKNNEFDNYDALIDTLFDAGCSPTDNLVITKNCNHNEVRMSLFSLALHTENTALIKKFIKKMLKDGVTKDALSHQGRAELHFAINTKNQDAIQFLLDLDVKSQHESVSSIRHSDSKCPQTKKEIILAEMGAKLKKTLGASDLYDIAAQANAPMKDSAPKSNGPCEISEQQMLAHYKKHCERKTQDGQQEVKNTEKSQRPKI